MEETDRSTYKYIGINYLFRNHYDDAIRYFNLWQYNYANKFKVDKYEYDFWMLNLIEDELSELQIPIKYELLKKNNKIRIVYLLHGITNSSSVLPKILLDIVKYSDTSKFEIHVFVVETWYQVFKSSGRVFMSQFKKSNCKIHYASIFSKGGFSNLLSMVKRISKLNPHIFITMAGLAEFDQFFIYALKPAPIRVGFIFAHPAQFVSPSYDMGIAWVDHIIKYSPVKCVNSGVLYVPDEKPIEKVNKVNMGLPSDSIVMISTGRYPKFQNIEVFKIIIEIMEELKNLHYIIIGTTIDQIALPGNISEDIKNRIHVYDWCNDYEKYVSVSDIYLDTYPSGGGFTLFDAAISHIPIISFTDDITKEFDQCEWNIAQELMSKESVILVDRYNIVGIKNVIRRLYYDIDYRKYIGNRGYEYVTNLRKEVKSNVKKIEELYIRLTDTLL